MKNSQQSLVPVIITVSACLIAVIIAFHSIGVTKDLRIKSEQDFQKIFSTLVKISNRLNSISNKLYSSQPKFIAKTSDNSGGQTKDWLNLLDSDLGKMENLLAKTGIDQLATNESVNASMLSEMVEEYAQQKKESDFKEMLKKNNDEFHKADKEKYDEKITALYDKAKFRWRNRNNKESEKAFNTMLKEYPDSYATGMLIAEKAISSGFRNNLDDAEKYYNMLSENKNFDNIVVDWGIEARPAIQYGLANKYIEQNRYDDAKKLIDDLQQYGSDDDYIFVRSGRRGRGMSWKPKSDVISSLNKKLSEMK